MKITIEIPDEVITEEVKAGLVKKITHDIYDRYGSEGYVYRKDLKEAIRAVLKENMNDLADRAVAAAAASLENRGIKKLLGKLSESNG